MKQPENMSLEELLELDNQIKVLTLLEFNMEKLYLESMKYKSYDSYRNSLPINKELKRLYNIILENLAKKIKNLNMDKEPLDIAILVSYFLLPLGCLSYTNKFHNIEKNVYSDIADYFDNNFSTLQGLYVIAGYGSCRHVNSFIVDLFMKLGIKADKISCYSTLINNPNKINNELLENNFEPNHLIVGYIHNNKYHLIDPYNKVYSLGNNESCYSHLYLEHNIYNCIVPNFSISLFQKELYWNPNIAYQSHNIDNINERINKIFEILHDGEKNNFTRFKITNFETIKKIAFLTPIELERTKEKEKHKQKRI